MRVEDYCPKGKRWWVRLHEKGGKRHEMPAHHTLEAYLDSYLEAAGIRDDGKAPLFPSSALPPAEEVDIAPTVEIVVSDGAVAVTDNGHGIAPGTVADILDYSSRVSSREAYASPTRGAQGNALKTLLAMPFALDGECGETVIESHGAAHRITFATDSIRQEPRINHVCEA